MPLPLVSVVMPSYQQARFLRTALDSVLAQDYAELEVLVLDGGSTDGTRELLSSYGDRIWYRSERDGGQSSAINEGFRRSRGEIVAWLNSDDLYYPGAVRAAVAALVARPDAAAVYGDGDLVDVEGRPVQRFPETVPFDLWRLANVSDYILQPTVFMRRSTLFDGGLLDEGLHWGMDWDLWLRLGRRWPLVYLPQVLAASRLHDDTKTATGGMRRLCELWAILRGHGVSSLSPAGVAHAATTFARRLRPSHGPVTPEQLCQGWPCGIGRLLRPGVAASERRLRRWLQNAQGVWPDRLVGRRGHLWLPWSGGRARLRLRGRNLALRDQVIDVRAGAARVRAPLAPGQAFSLELDVAEGASPCKAELRCAKTERAAPLDPHLGERQAGCVLEAWELSA